MSCSVTGLLLSVVTGFDLELLQSRQGDDEQQDYGGLPGYEVEEEALEGHGGFSR